MTDWMDDAQDKIAKVAWAKEKLIGVGKLRGLSRQAHNLRNGRKRNDR